MIGQAQERIDNWQDATVVDSYFEDCIFEGTWDVFVLKRCTFVRCDFRGGRWMGGGIADSKFVGCRLPSYMTDVGVDGSMFIRCDLREAGEANRTLKASHPFGDDNAFVGCTFVACLLPPMHWKKGTTVATDGRNMRFERSEALSDAPAMDWRPQEVVPEDFYSYNGGGRRRRSRH
jgi:hypothetical protein